MACFHLLRSLNRLPATLGTHGQLSVARSCLAAQFVRPTSNLTGLRPMLTPILAKNSFLVPAPSALSVRSIGTSQPRAAATTGDHVRLWQIERLIAVAMIGLAPACIIMENPFIDGVFAVLLVMHSHWGLEAVILDYARPIVVGPIVPKVAFFLLNLLSAATLAGLLLLIYNGPGLGKVIKKGWAIGTNQGNES